MDLHAPRKQERARLRWKLDISHLIIFVRKSELAIVALLPFLFMHFRTCLCQQKRSFLQIQCVRHFFFKVPLVFFLYIQFCLAFNPRPFLVDHSVKFGCNLIWWISHVGKAGNNFRVIIWERRWCGSEPLLSNMLRIDFQELCEFYHSPPSKPRIASKDPQLVHIRRKKLNPKCDSKVLTSQEKRYRI